jgi:hypothetical protein
MSARAYPLADLHEALARLERQTAGAGCLEGTSPRYFQEALLPMLAALGEVAKAARVAIEPAMVEESHRVIAANYWRSHYSAGEA